jgi:hypothetical protein
MPAGIGRANSTTRKASAVSASLVRRVKTVFLACGRPVAHLDALKLRREERADGAAARDVRGHERRVAPRAGLRAADEPAAIRGVGFDLGCCPHGRSYQVLGTSLTARLAALRPAPGSAVRMRMLLHGQRRASIVPALRGFLAEPLDTGHLHSIEAPSLILTQPADALHPLRSGEILYDLLPDAALCVAPTLTFWDRSLEETADLVAAFVCGRDSFPAQFAAERGCTFRTKKSGR